MPEVYPRAYGETIYSVNLVTAPGGLSPRLRGNPLIYSVNYGAVGSIPALTGKPGRRQLLAIASTVYPRAYGETTHKFVKGDIDTGLSPRLRGNR